MALLFAVGRLFFGVSLGPEPWALALPTVGIVAAGAALASWWQGSGRAARPCCRCGRSPSSRWGAGGCWWPIDLEPHWMQSVARAFCQRRSEFRQIGRFEIRRGTASFFSPLPSKYFLSPFFFWNQPEAHRRLAGILPRIHRFQTDRFPRFSRRRSHLPDLLGDGRLQRPDDPPPNGERGNDRDSRAPRLRRRLSGRRPPALPPSS